MVDRLNMNINALAIRAAGKQLECLLGALVVLLLHLLEELDQFLVALCILNVLVICLGNLPEHDRGR